MNIFDLYNQLNDAYNKQEEKFNKINSEYKDIMEKREKMLNDYNTLSIDIKNINEKAVNLLRKKGSIEDELNDVKSTLKKLDIWDIIKNMKHLSEEEAKEQWNNLIDGKLPENIKLKDKGKKAKKSIPEFIESIEDYDIRLIDGNKFDYIKDNVKEGIIYDVGNIGIELCLIAICYFNNKLEKITVLICEAIENWEFTKYSFMLINGLNIANYSNFYITNNFLKLNHHREKKKYKEISNLLNIKEKTRIYRTSKKVR